MAGPIVGGAARDTRVKPNCCCCCSAKKEREREREKKNTNQKEEEEERKRWDFGGIFKIQQSRQHLII